ncbi:MAG: dihydroorotate dehydrogenase-like protein [Anaerolineae bacterium]
MDLTTDYLGLRLDHPLVASASPLSRSLDGIRGLEDAGAAAVVLHSLFEEEIIGEEEQLDHYLSYFTEAFAEALTWYPEGGSYRVGPEQYLETVRRAKEAVRIPIIGSLNGTSAGGWVAYARQIQQAGADALELNIYMLASDPRVDGAAVEATLWDVVRMVKGSITIPVAVKLSPYYSALAHLATRLSGAGVDGLVLFNRFYQPDLDLEELSVVPSLAFSSSEELRLPLRWVAMLYGHVPVDLAISTGVHTHEDALKGLMAGAQVVMMTSELLQNGVGRLGEMRQEMVRWLEAHDYQSVAQLRGSMSQRNVADPAAYARANYVRVLQAWRPDPAGQLFREVFR